MKNVRKLTEGAILLAAFAVLLLLTIYVPFLGMIVNLFLAVPFMLFASKNDGKSIVVFIVASLLLSFIVGTIMSLPLTLAYGTTGVVIGYLIQKQKNMGVLFITGSLVFLVNLIIIYVASIVLFKVDMITEMIEMMRESLNVSADLLKNFGNTQDSEKVLEQFNNGLNLIKTLIPTLFVLSSFLIVFIMQLISFPIIKRFGVRVEKWKSFKEISLPKSILYYFLLTLLVNMLMNPEEGSFWYMAIINMTYILQFLMILQGYTFMFYYFDKKGFSKAVSITIAIVSFLIPIFLYIVGILGIIDLGFDLRKGFNKKE
ncbi:YybS family protein [Neobacillus sp. 179-C4.2 HS]|uniref:YybS family protein n=1 Tax=Neobacillus driksii TaxID=3035913 RepID=A0ABV4Z114_9BACI|nr:YybS family protein [Neobacillus sp. 179.-C4.2 HS]MDP5194333.1 YybS family protein [Neobacillus sp. 179.-C4.2 HS]